MTEKTLNEVSFQTSSSKMSSVSTPLIRSYSGKESENYSERESSRLQMKSLKYSS